MGTATAMAIGMALVFGICRLYLAKVWMNLCIEIDHGHSLGNGSALALAKISNGLATAMGTATEMEMGMALVLGISKVYLAKVWMNLCIEVDYGHSLGNDLALASAKGTALVLPLAKPLVFNNLAIASQIK